MFKNIKMIFFVSLILILNNLNLNASSSDLYDQQEFEHVKVIKNNIIAGEYFFEYDNKDYSVYIFEENKSTILSVLNKQDSCLYIKKIEYGFSIVVSGDSFELSNKGRTVWGTINKNQYNLISSKLSKPEVKAIFLMATYPPSVEFKVTMK